MDIAGLVKVRVQADLDPLEAGFGEARSLSGRLDRDLSRGFQNAGRSAERFGTTVRGSSRSAALGIDGVTGSAGRAAAQLNLVARAGAVAGSAILTALGGREVLAASEDYTRLTNALRVTGAEGERLAEVQDRLFAAANRNGVAINALGSLYSRASIAAGELGASEEELLRFVDGVTAALRVQGGSTEAASGALLQLSQALGSGVVRGEEFNSILEGAFPIAQAAARGIDGMGGSVARLRTAVINGEVTSREFFEGLLDGFTTTEAIAAKMSLTIGGSLTVLRNSFVRFVGELDAAAGASATISSAIQSVGLSLDGMAQNVDTAMMVAVAGVALLAARTAGPLVAAQISAGTAATAHAAALVSGNAVMINSARAAAMRATFMAEAALADQFAKTAALEAAQADLIRARNLHAVAQAGQVAGLTQAQAHANVVASSRAVVAAQLELAASSAAATGAINAQSIAMQRNALAARVLAGAAAVASRALAFVGGPAGVAILAIGAAFYLASRRAMDAEERSGRYAEAIRKAGEQSDGAAPGIRAAAAALQMVERSATAAENAVSRLTTQEDISSLAAEMAATIQQLGALQGWSSVEMQAQLQALQRDFFKGSTTAEELIQKVDELARLNPDASPIISEIQRIAREAAAAMGVLDALNATITDVVTTPKTDRLGAPKPLDEDDFNDRFGGRYAKTWKELFPDLFREEKGRDPYGEMIDGARRYIAEQEHEAQAVGMSAREANRLRFEMEMLNEARRDGIELTPEQTKEIKTYAAAMADAAEAASQAERAHDVRREGQDRIRELQQEKDALGLTGAAAEALRFEQDLLAQAMDKTGKISPDQRKEIHALAQEYAALAQAITKARLEQDVMFEREQLFRSEDEQAIAARLRGTGIGLDSALADEMRRNQYLAEGKDLGIELLTGIRDSVLKGGKDIGETILTVISNALLRYSDKAIDRLVSSLLGNLAGGGGATDSIVTSALGAASKDAWAGLREAANDNAAVLAGSVGSYTAAVSKGASVYRDAIASIESAGSGDYAAIGPTHPTLGRALGRYQIMEANIGPWSQEALGKAVSPSEFLGSREIQDAVFDKKFESYVSRFGERGAAQAWFGGPGSVGKVGRSDVLGTTVGGYGDKFMGDIQRLGGASGQAGTAITQMATDTTAAGFATKELAANAVSATDGLGSLTKGVESAASNLLGATNNAPTLAGGAAAGGGAGGGLLGNLVGGIGSFFQSIFGGIGSLFGFAEGTPNAPGGWAMVGEKGPEVVKLPRGSEVIPNHRAARFFNPGNTNSRQQPQTVQVQVSGVFVDDGGVIQGKVTSMGREAAQAGAEIATQQVQKSLPGMMADVMERSG